MERKSLSYLIVLLNGSERQLVEKILPFYRPQGRKLHPFATLNSRTCYPGFTSETIWSSHTWLARCWLYLTLAGHEVWSLHVERFLALWNHFLLFICEQQI